MGIGGEGVPGPVSISLGVSGGTLKILGVVCMVPMCTPLEFGWRPSLYEYERSTLIVTVGVDHCALSERHVEAKELTMHGTS